MTSKKKKKKTLVKSLPCKWQKAWWYILDDRQMTGKFLILIVMVITWLHVLINSHTTVHFLDILFLLCYLFIWLHLVLVVHQGSPQNCTFICYLCPYFLNGKKLKKKNNKLHTRIYSASPHLKKNKTVFR